ncbi:MerR family transcriptional regulator [Nocardia callitridis]|uniref:MerR family transcriptional regulator n=1 Tax=Nocardia callitridis TaxID=648753 RepID=A0ABP9KXC7_9NOCA
MTCSRVISPARSDMVTDRYAQIGQVAERTELSLKTIRHYDEVGLVQPSARSAGGFRLYTDADIERLLVIRRMKPLGFTLAEMKHLLDSLDVLDDSHSSGEQRASAKAYLLECRAKTFESADRLRRHLAYAEEFGALLTTSATTRSD